MSATKQEANIEQEEEECLFGNEEMFKIDDNYYKKPKPNRIESYHFDKSLNPNENFTEIHLSLLGEHHLWGNYLWNASKCLAQYFYNNPTLIRGKRVCEFGAAGGLPSLTCGKLGAKQVVITDIDHKNLIENLQKNIDINSLQENVIVKGHAWGELLEECFGSGKDKQVFDVLILSDLLFNHICHDKLLDSCEYVSHEDTMIYVSYTHHRPWLIKEDLGLFKLAKERGFIVEHLFDQKFDPMFLNDPGDIEERSTVHVQIMRPPIHKQK
ncbi:hypothetical protein ABK040_014454 [Willaertia magna]